MFKSIPNFAGGYQFVDPDLVVGTLAQRWTAAVDWSTYDVAREIIEASNGFLDPGVAERTERRLKLPAP